MKKHYENKLKIHIGQPLNRSYTLVKNGNYNFKTSGLKLLNYQTDVDDFLKEVATHKRNLYIANDQYLVEVNAYSRQWDEQLLKRMLNTAYLKWIMEEPYMSNPDQRPIRNISSMEDFLLDQNQKTGWVAGKHQDKYKIDFNLKSLQAGLKLEKNAMIKAIGIYLGYGKTINEFTKYNRIKKIKILFSKNYRGGIGKNQVCYDAENNFIIKLQDKQDLQIIYFLKPVSAKSIRFLIEDTYIGYDNIIGLNEVIFYVLDRRNI